MSSLAVGTACQAAWDTPCEHNGVYTCGARIEWLHNSQGQALVAARTTVATECADDCAACMPVSPSPALPPPPLPPPPSAPPPPPSAPSPDTNCPGLADKKKCKITKMVKKCEKKPPKSMKKCQKNCKKDAKKKTPLCQKTCCKLGFRV